MRSPSFSKGSGFTTNFAKLAFLVHFGVVGVFANDL
jgi:hypothetical protein